MKIDLNDKEIEFIVTLINNLNLGNSKEVLDLAIGLKEKLVIKVI